MELALIIIGLLAIIWLALLTLKVYSIDLYMDSMVERLENNIEDTHDHVSDIAKRLNEEFTQKTHPRGTSPTIGARIHGLEKYLGVATTIETKQPEINVVTKSIKKKVARKTRG